LSSEPKHPKLVFKRSINHLKFYFYFLLLLLVGAGVARAGATSATAIFACLQATAEVVLVNLAAVALGNFYDVIVARGY
jgi:hypothetical protein